MLYGKDSSNLGQALYFYRLIYCGFTSYTATGYDKIAIVVGLVKPYL